MKMEDIKVKFIVDTSRLETLMEELNAFRYVPNNAWSPVPNISGSGGSIRIQATHPTFLHLQCVKIPGDALEALMDIGGCSVSKEVGEETSTLSLDGKIYHQFHSQGLIFSTDGRAFDPSYSTIRLASPRWFLRRYTSYSGSEVDRWISFRDAEWVLFPIGTQEKIGEDGEMVYMWDKAPGEQEREMVIDEKGHLSLRKKKREFKKGEKVLVTLQNAILKGTYNCDGLGQGSDAAMAYIDFDEQEREYLLVNTERVFHAE